MAERAEGVGMKEVTFRELLDLGEKWNKNKIKWHNHYFTPQCKFNDKAPMFKVTVENEETGEVFVCVSENHKLENVEKLEKLVYQNIKAFQARS